MLPMSWLAASEIGCPSDQAGVSSALFSTPRNPLASSRRPPEPKSTSECMASPMTNRIPANVGSSQLMDGWPDLK
jgi:hypothetical protein